MIKFLGIALLGCLAFGFISLLRDISKFRDGFDDFDAEQEFRDALALDYVSVQEKISDFKSRISTGAESKLQLSAAEINCISLRGRDLIEECGYLKHSMYLKYRISESSLLENHIIQFPFFRRVVRKFKAFEYEIDFVPCEDDRAWLEKRTLITINGSLDVEGKLSLLVENESFLQRLFSSIGFYEVLEGESELIISKIRNINIESRILNLEG